MKCINYPRYLHTSDICVLELAAAADLTSPSISVVAVPPSLQQYEAGTLCTVAGWGTTTEGGNMAEVVMKVGNWQRKYRIRELLYILCLWAAT